MLDLRTRAELQARVGAADAARKRAAAGTEGARVALQQARNEQQRTEQLAGQGFVAPTKADADRLAVQAAQKALQAAEEGEHVALHDLRLAQAALGAVQAGPSGGSAAVFEIKSPIAGRVLKIAQVSEGSVAGGAPLMEIGDTARLEVVAELLTTDALQVRAGMPVRIERWGGPGSLAGRVVRVEPAAFTKVSALGVEEQRVNVIVEITSPPAAWSALGDGFRVSLRIVTRSEAQVLRVPVSAVFPLTSVATPAASAASAAAPGSGPTDAVFVVEQGRARRVPVTLGARNGNEAWVRDGLAAGARVIVYPPAALADGARVRERRV
jgi:HlyD family secretion protein